MCVCINFGFRGLVIEMNDAGIDEFRSLGVSEMWES